MKEATKPECALCAVEVRVCRSPNGTAPKFCPTKNKTRELKKALKKYENPETMRFAKAASLQEAECYARRGEKPFVMRPTKTRVEEVIEFSQKMGYKKLGVAFCAGLFGEGKALVQILEKHGFEVASVCCKVGGVPKEFLGLKDSEKVRVGTDETMCNPITQAEVLNAAGTEFNILVGLCVGHDALLSKHAKALTTVLVAKDRVLGHNPVAALYGAKGYFQRLLNP
jgi:uncharacterized metal-binding protein